MSVVGKHQGSALAEAPDLDRAQMFKLALGLTLTLVAWGLLVWLAIDFGTEARSGSMVAWLFLLVATLGATACLFLGLTLGSRLFAAMRGDTEVLAAKPRPAGGKRAAR